jgi:alpha-N-acetylglucosaminidase
MKVKKLVDYFRKERRTMKRFWILTAIAFVCLQSSVLFADISLVQDGKAQAVIAIGTGAAWIDQHAAEELTKFVEEMTGTGLDIVDADSSAAGAASNLILIGRQENNKLIAGLAAAGKIELSASSPGGEGYTIKTVSDGSCNYLVLGGSRGRGDLYAVYDFLEQDCGVGFFWNGDRVPQQTTLKFSSIDRTEKPYFTRRMAPNACSYVYTSQFWGVQEWCNELDYMSKRKLNMHYFTIGREYVMNQVWKRFGLEQRDHTDWELWAARLQKEVRAYAEKLDMDHFVGQAWGGTVTPEFAALHPEIRYVTRKWIGLPTKYNIHPADPMYRKITKASIEEWQKAYGPTHIWDQAPYPETSPGATEEDKLQIKIDWAENVSAVIAEADPEGVLYMSGWFLAAGSDWTEDVTHRFFKALNGRYIISDTWADKNTVHIKSDYFGGGQWDFGVLQTFGNVQRPHGDLADVLNRAKQVVADPKAKNCTGFYINPESTHHNFLYFDLATEMAWDPRPVELEDFLSRYCVRRYGPESAAAMVRAWKLVAETVYGDNTEDNPIPTYQAPLPQRPGGIDAFSDNYRRRLGYIPTLRQALALALVPKDRQKDNPHYQRDIIDIGCTLFGLVFDRHAFEIKAAFEQSNRAKLDQEAAAALKVLDGIGDLVATQVEFFIEEEMKLGRKLPTRTYIDFPSVLNNDEEVRRRYTALAGMDKYPTLLDYAATDRVEVIRYFYRPRIEAWLNYMRDNLGGEIEFNSLGNGPYKDIAQSFVDGKYETPKSIPSGEIASDVATSLLVDLATDTNLLVNGDFETGDGTGWNTYSIGMTTAEVNPARPHPSGDSYSLQMDLPTGSAVRYLDWKQDALVVSEPYMYFDYYLESWTGNPANTNVMLYIFDSTWKQTGFIYWWWGNGSWGHVTQGPTATAPYHKISAYQGSEVGTWHSIAANVAEEFDTEFGAGIWDSLNCTYINVQVQCGASNSHSGIHGFLDNVLFLQGPRATPRVEALIDPLNGEEGVDLNATLQWNEPTDSSASQNYYVVDYGTDPNFIDARQIQTAVGVTIAQPGAPLASETDYYWRVNTVAPNNGCPVVLCTSSQWSFKTTALYTAAAAVSPVDVGISIVEDGKAKAVIAIGTGAPWIDRHAAEELSKFVEEMTGTGLDIVHTGSYSAGNANNLILIGRQETNELTADLTAKGKIKLSESQPGGDGFTVKTVSDASRNYLILGGSCDRGNLYAVYDFLEEECGVGYFWDGDRVPRKATLTFSSIDRTERPYFTRRFYFGACAWTYTTKYWDKKAWIHEYDWMAKRKFNTLWAAIREGDYVKNLEIDVTHGIWGGRVTPEFVKANPEVKYITTQWLDLPPTHNIDPADPMFHVKVCKSIKDRLPSVYGTHLWNQAPYPETSPGATEAEKLQIKTDWARNMSAAVAEVDPGGILWLSGWFLQGPDWTSEICSKFFASMANDHYFVADSWAESFPTYLKADYFGGRGKWSFGVLHTFGNVDRLHGDVADLIARVKKVVADPKAKNCVGLDIVPESTHHNFLYFDLAADLAWDPRKVELDDYLRRYSVRRYGEESADAMAAAWKLVAQSAYANNIEANPTALYQNPLPKNPGGGDRLAKDEIDKRISFIPDLKIALELALAERDKLADNPFYQRDIVDIANALFGFVFDRHAFQMRAAFEQNNEEKFNQQASAGLEVLDDIVDLIATRPEFFLQEEIERGVAMNGEKERDSISREVRQRHTALAGVENYPTLVDYAATDRVELLRYYYRPRIEAWISHMRDNLGGEIDTAFLLHGPYKEACQSFVEGDFEACVKFPSGQKASDVAAALLVKLNASAKG